MNLKKEIYQKDIDGLSYYFFNPLNELYTVNKNCELGITVLRADDIAKGEKTNYHTVKEYKDDYCILTEDTSTKTVYANYDSICKLVIIKKEKKVKVKKEKPIKKIKESNTKKDKKQSLKSNKKVIVEDPDINSYI